MPQQIKLTLAFHIAVPAGSSPGRCTSSLTPVDVPRKQWMMAQLFGPLLPTWRPNRVPVFLLGIAGIWRVNSADGRSLFPLLFK